MQTPEDFANDLYEQMDFWDHTWKANDEGGIVAADLIRARDAEVRADERQKALAGSTEERADRRRGR